MGEQKVSLLTDKSEMQKFVKQLLEDVQSLEYMLDNDWFEKDIIRIGAEQEMCMVNNDTMKPAFIAIEALDKMKSYEWVETELAKFNLETNFDPREFKGDCLAKMEHEARSNLTRIQKTLDDFDVSVVLTGILPTLRKDDLNMDSLTPKKRYYALMEAINDQLTTDAYELRLSGIDELNIKHDSPLIEACNTSFQVHLQINPDEFVKMYNISQVLAAPMIAISSNSPLVFGKRLWHESRIALFQQSLDTRASHDHMREKSPRVNFGNGWLKDSILEIYQEDIARFRVLIAGDIQENSIDEIAKGNVPKLRALQVHNSTVYRWNRPCYGISPNGKPHLRIENRVLAAGPTVVDEIANTAFWLGLMVGMADKYEDIRDHISWDDAADNFGKSAKYGIDSTFTWFNDEKITAVDLIIKKLIPIARKGLQIRKVDKKDIDKYLDIIKARAKAHMTGARWILRSFTKLKEETTTDEALACLTSSIIKNQKTSMPVHEWKLPELSELVHYKPSQIKVEEFMTTDLFTVQKDDIIEFVAEMMDWRKTRYTAVENKNGELVGLITQRLLLRYLIKNPILKGKVTTVNDIMLTKPFTISPEKSIMDALEVMRENKVGCLPVVKGKELIGMITEKGFLSTTSRLIERLGK